VQKLDQVPQVGWGKKDGNGPCN